MQSERCKRLIASFNEKWMSCANSCTSWLLLVGGWSRPQLRRISNRWPWCRISRSKQSFKRRPCLLLVICNPSGCKIQKQPPRTGACYICGTDGHFSHECPNTVRNLTLVPGQHIELAQEWRWGRSDFHIQRAGWSDQHDSKCLHFIRNQWPEMASSVRHRVGNDFDATAPTSDEYLDVGYVPFERSPEAAISHWSRRWSISYDLVNINKRKLWNLDRPLGLPGLLQWSFFMSATCYLFEIRRCGWVATAVAVSHGTTVSIA